MLGRIMGAMPPIAVARVVSMVCALVQLPLLTRSLYPSVYALLVGAISTSTYYSLAAGDPAALAFQRFPGSISTGSRYNFDSRQLASSLAIGALLLVLAGVATGHYD